MARSGGEEDVLQSGPHCPQNTARGPGQARDSVSEHTLLQPCHSAVNQAQTLATCVLSSSTTDVVSDLDGLLRFTDDINHPRPHDQLL